MHHHAPNSQPHLKLASSASILRISDHITLLIILLLITAVTEYVTNDWLRLGSMNKVRFNKQLRNKDSKETGRLYNKNRQMTDREIK